MMKLAKIASIFCTVVLFDSMAVAKEKSQTTWGCPDLRVHCYNFNKGE